FPIMMDNFRGPEGQPLKGRQLIQTGGRVRRAKFCTVLAVAASFLLAGCDDNAERFTGYVEGDFALPAPIASGRLMDMKVARGDRVKAGAALFDLEDGQETAVR